MAWIQYTTFDNSFPPLEKPPQFWENWGAPCATHFGRQLFVPVHIFHLQAVRKTPPPPPHDERNIVRSLDVWRDLRGDTQGGGLCFGRGASVLRLFSTRCRVSTHLTCDRCFKASTRTEATFWRFLNRRFHRAECRIAWSPAHGNLKRRNPKIYDTKSLKPSKA